MEVLQPLLLLVCNKVSGFYTFVACNLTVAMVSGSYSVSVVKSLSFRLPVLLVPGLNFGSLTSTAATSTPTATLTTSTSSGPSLSFGAKLGGRK